MPRKPKSQQNPLKRKRRKRRIDHKIRMALATVVADLFRPDRGLRTGTCFRCMQPTRHAMFKGVYACPDHEAELTRGRVAEEATYDIHGHGRERCREIPPGSPHVQTYRPHGKERPRHWDEETYGLQHQGLRSKALGVPG